MGGVKYTKSTINGLPISGETGTHIDGQQKQITIDFIYFRESFVEEFILSAGDKTQSFTLRVEPDVFIGTVWVVSFTLDSEMENVVRCKAVLSYKF